MGRAGLSGQGRGPWICPATIKYTTAPAAGSPSYRHPISGTDGVFEVKDFFDRAVTCALALFDSIERTLAGAPLSFPCPVGALTRTCSPRAMAGQARSCASVGAAKRPPDHRRISGWKSCRAKAGMRLAYAIVQRGFAHLACEDCGLPRLVAFTCAGRGFCPTCVGHRMNQTTHNLLAHVVPAQPLRQWVLTLPFALRAPLAYKPPKPPPSGKRCRYIKWAELMRLTFGLTVEQCPACGGRMKLRALVRDPESIERLLGHQGMWSPPAEASAARAPPYRRAVTRLAPTRQQELFPET